MVKPTDFSHIHFIGIGGIGMSALARLCLSEGKTVTGSDAHQSLITEALTAEGVQISYEQVAENISGSTDLVIYTEAISKDNPEYVAAKNRKLKTINYFDALGFFLNEYYLIAVAGSHGKTTTTAMLADIFEAADLDPTVVVGSLRAKTGSNFRAGKSKYAIVEACEFRRDFLSLEPDVLVITNIEYEHVDYYKNLADVQAAFRELARKVPEDGLIVANTDDPHVAAALQDIATNKVDYSQFIDPRFELSVPGLHNLMNAAAAIAVAHHEGVDIYLAREALKDFKSTWRRFEHKGNVHGAEVIDDYAHHPTEIKMTLKAARDRYPDKRIVAVFQAHTHTRTRELFEDFVSVLTKADEVVLLPVYGARDEKVKPVEIEDMRDAIAGHNPHVRTVATLDDAVTYVRETVGENDIVLVLGAGDITKVASDLTK